MCAQYVVAGDCDMVYSGMEAINGVPDDLAGSTASNSEDWRRGALYDGHSGCAHAKDDGGGGTPLDVSDESAGFVE